MYKIEITEEEKRGLFELLNIAVKAIGLESNYASNAIYFKNKIESGKFKPQTTTEPCTEQQKQ